MGSCTARRYGSSHEGFVQHAQRVGTVVLICVVVWAATGFGTFWPLWVALFLGVKLAAHARLAYQDRDDEAFERDDELTAV